jgi:hypothetical protein
MALEGPLACCSVNGLTVECEMHTCGCCVHRHPRRNLDLVARSTHTEEDSRELTARARLYVFVVWWCD